MARKANYGRDRAERDGAARATVRRAGFTTCGIQSCYNYREAAHIFRVPLAVH